MPKHPFTRKIAKEIAENQMAYVVGGILGHNDPDYSITDCIDVFEQNFSEDLEERNITVTPGRIEVINQEFEKIRNTIIIKLEKHLK